MSVFEKVDVTPDTPQWLQERRNSVGASEVAAIMGLSPYGTALDVYRDKLGVGRDFDPLLSFVGHESEHIIHKWVEEFSGLDVLLKPGFMGRSIEWPFLHASFDRVTEAPFLAFQFKTSHFYAGHHWDEGIPVDVRVQVQAEMAVAGTRRAAVVVWIGGRDFKLFWEPRDDRFINEQLIPAVQTFWDANVRAQVAPNPSTVSEVNAVQTVEAEVELSDEAYGALEMITVLSSDIQAMEKERDGFRIALSDYVGVADTLTHAGQKVATWRTQKGRTGFDKSGFAANHPDLLAEYTVQGQPFRVLRRTKPKEATK